MHFAQVDPSALKEKPDPTRQAKSTPRTDALPLGTIIGILGFLARMA